MRAAPVLQRECKTMTRRIGGLLGVCQAMLFALATLVPPAEAADMAGPADYFDFEAPQAGTTSLAFAGPVEEVRGNLAMMANLDWAERLEESEMADLRGGFGGYSFSLYWAGNVDQLGPNFGNLTVNGNGVTALPGGNLNNLVGDSAGGQVFFESLAGSFSNFNGAAQSLNIIGNNIIAQQTMLLNLNIINVTDSTALRVGALNGLLGM